MWVFLLTELLLFSGMFVSALVIRVMHPDSVTAVALHLKYWIGATNTAVLIVSSFCMSIAIELSRLGRRRLMLRFMMLTAALGALFLMLKGYEYYRDYVEHMMPFLSGAATSWWATRHRNCSPTCISSSPACTPSI